jgi:hypothetical protein
LIRVGSQSRGTWAAKRASEALAGMAALLLLVWILRTPLGISDLSLFLLDASFVFIFAGRAFRTRTNSGARRALSSFLWNLTAASVVVIVLVWLLGWIAGIQSETLPPGVQGYVPDLVIAGIVTGLAAYAVNKLTPGGARFLATGPAFLVGGETDTVLGPVKIRTKRDLIGVPIRRSGRILGCELEGDVSASFETPMGKVTATIPGPVTSFGVPFAGRRLGNEETFKLTGKRQDDLVREVGEKALRSESGWDESFDLPFVHIRRDSLVEDVEVGPIKVHSGPDGEQVRIGGLSFNSDDRNKKGLGWAVSGAGGVFLRGSGNFISAKWNGSALSFDSSSMKLSVGSDAFSYSQSEVSTSSPLHTLKVARDKVTLDTKKFTLKVDGIDVLLRTEGKTSSSKSPALAADLTSLLTDVAKKQVQDVMDGLPIDFSEMLASTEKVLAKHG